MKNLLKILTLTLIFASCKKEFKKKTELEKSRFNIKTDLTDFKNKMTESDTIKIWFNHSVCTYQGYERILITKKSNKINILTEFKEDTFVQNPEWKIVYKKQLPVNDTTWKIEKFFKKNVQRQDSQEKEFGTLQVSHNGIRIHYFTKGLIDLNIFMIDYFETMKVIHPENTNNIYGEEIIEIDNLNDKKLGIEIE